MKISVMGIGHNELQSGKALAEMGNEVIYVCKDNRHVENLKRGHCNSREKEILQQIHQKRYIDFTADIREALDNSNMCFIAENDNETDEALFRILATARDVGANMSSHTFIIDRSTLPVNRTEQIKSTIQNELDKRASNLTFEVISNPDFLRA